MSLDLAGLLGQKVFIVDMGKHPGAAHGEMEPPAPGQGLSSSV